MKHALTTLFILAALLSGCSPLRLLDAVTPDDGYKLHGSLAYGDLPRQKLDVYVPDKPDPAHSVVVFFYGGRWQTGHRADYRFVGQSLASRGYLTIIADYRLFPQATFPANVEDAAKAIVWTHGHVARYGGDPRRLFVAGHSAGAHLAMLATLDPRYLKQAGGNTTMIAGTIGLAGPYDFLPFTDEDVKAVFADVPASQTQPINFVRPHAPPILLLHGDADTSVRLKNSANLAAALRQAGNTVTFKAYSDVDHVGIVQALSVRFPNKAPTIRDIRAFIDATPAR